nr:hypothetical protein [Rhizobium leguminosarum]
MVNRIPGQADIEFLGGDPALNGAGISGDERNIDVREFPAKRPENPRQEPERKTR